MRVLDAAVLGGGPGGLAAALALRQCGARVAVYDAQRPPIDKACGEGLMPYSVRILEKLGVSFSNEDGAAFAGISLHEGLTVARGAFCEGSGRGIRRILLHGRLAARADEAGVELHWGAGVQAGPPRFSTAGAPIAADFFVIADGLCSTLAHTAGFRERRCMSTRYAFCQPFRCPPWSDTVEVHWGQNEQVYVTPLGVDEINIALLTSRRRRRLRDALADFPALARRMEDAQPTAPERGAITRTRSLRQVVRGNVALLGDASGSVDAITGEGLQCAFQQALALAEAFDAGKLELYAEAHRRMAKNPERIARLLLLLDRYPALRQCALATLATRPECLTAFMNVHDDGQNYFKAVRSLAGRMVADQGRKIWPASFIARDPYKERGL